MSQARFVTSGVFIKKPEAFYTPGYSLKKTILYFGHLRNLNSFI